MSKSGNFGLKYNIGTLKVTRKATARAEVFFPTVDLPKALT